MRQRGLTLVELMAALAIAGVVASIAAVLLFRSMDVVSRDADAFATRREATLALDALAADLAAQPDLPELPAPLDAFALDAEAPRASFFVAAADGTRSVSWYLSGSGPFSLKRVEVDAKATASALPANAAEARTKALVSDAPESGGPVPIVACRSVLSLRLTTSIDGAIPQLLMTSLTSEGLRRLSAGETAAQLPPRCVESSAKPLPVR